jgi:hypothetical protein
VRTERSSVLVVTIADNELPAEPVDKGGSDALVKIFQQNIKIQRY